MERVSEKLLKRLRLADAIDGEAQATQSLMPQSPGWPGLASEKDKLVDWLKGQLLNGYVASPQQIVSTRKAQHGIRPVPVWGAPERIIYRALVDFILRNVEPVDRSVSAYRDFLAGPVDHAQENYVPDSDANGPFAILAPFTAAASNIKYIVKTDITAFYQYIDHAILADELITQNGDYEAVQHLISFLGEVQGRSFGLPQLLDPSDRLSEVYIDVLERDMLRKGWVLWRYNDDFRIAVESYGKALAAIEELDASARKLGLTISESKTTTPKFATYVWDNWTLALDDEIPEDLASREPDVFVADYGEGGGGYGVEWATDIVASCYVPPKEAPNTDFGPVDLTDLQGDHFRLIRRAFNKMQMSEHADALNRIVDFIVYVPALTPWLIRYAIKVGPQDIDKAAEVLNKIRIDVSLSDWQRIWLIRAYRDLSLLERNAPGDPSATQEWLTTLLRNRHAPAIHAEAVLALASIEGVELGDIEFGLRECPAALAGWYLSALSKMNDIGKVTTKQFNAVSGSNPLYKAYLTARVES